ncbi:uncharacterized protein LOC118203086, partial [Stegodyphus dumicola]|uniref:uncharacterized protein LOC118203086 n=1 Tax=Stegodyphus dumicola TaxID=202533 RepID=UPI0015ADCD18
MTSMQLVFLFDLNAFNSVQLKSTRELNENLQSLRLTCLRLLTYFSNEVRTLRWGFKFFDSCGSLTQAMDKFTYQNFSLENFEILENEICLRYQRHVSYLEALAESVQRNTTLASNMLSSNQNELQKPYPIKLLQLALTQILCEYHWESFDVTSPVRSTNEQIERKNYLFFVTKCTETVEDFKCYFGVKHVPVKNSRIHSLLLSPSLHKQLLGRAGIQWVWLSTSKNNFLSTSKSEVLSKMSDALQSLQCSLIPLSVLSQPVRRPTIKEKNNLTMDPADESTNSLYVHYAFIPFSTVFRQSLRYPFYSINDHMINKSVLCSPQNGKEIPVSIINFSLQSKRDEKRSSEKYNNTASEACNTAAWSKFVIRYAVKRNIHSTAYDLLLCLPLVSATSSTDFNFRDLIKALIIEDKSLVVDCETVTPGLMIPGLFSPLSDDAAVISIIDPAVSFFEHKKIDFPKSIHHKQVNEVELKAEIEKEMKCLLDSKEVTPSVEVKKDGFLIKPFEAECLETWFAPNQSLSNLANEISTDQIT